MHFIFKSGIVSIFFIAIYASGSGQEFLNKFEIGVQAGSFIYQGDLTPQAIGSLKTPGFGVMVFADRYLNRSFSLRTNFTFARLHGDDAKYGRPYYRQQRNFNFNATMGELSQVIVWNVLGKNSFAPVKNGFQPYLFAGLGVNFLDIHRDASLINREWFASEPIVLTALDEDLAHRLPTVLPVLPVGAGVKYYLKPKIAIYAEAGYRFTATDYLDGFSKSANSSRKDSYSSLSVGISFKFGKNNFDCPELPK